MHNSSNVNIMSSLHTHASTHVDEHYTTQESFHTNSPGGLIMGFAPPPLAPVFTLNMGAFFNMSGKMKNRIMLPRMNICSTLVTRPSLAVTVMLCIWQFMLSSASSSLPLYTSPVTVSSVMMWPSASWRSLIGIPMDIVGTCKTALAI